MGIPEYPSLYYDTLVHLSVVVERWLYRLLIRRRIRAIVHDIGCAQSTEAFFTAPVLDEERSYSHCYFLSGWSRLLKDMREQSGSLYLTKCGGFLAELEPFDEEPRTLVRVYPSEILSVVTLSQLFKNLKPARHEALSRLRDYDWERGVYVV